MRVYQPYCAGFSKGNLKELQTKEIKNGRLAMGEAQPGVQANHVSQLNCKTMLQIGLRPCAAADMCACALPLPVAFAGFTLQAQATGKGPLANLGVRISLVYLSPYRPEHTRFEWSEPPE